MTRNRGIMSSFTHASNSVILADGSRTPIQSISTAATTLSFLYHMFSIYLFSFQLIISKIINNLIYTVMFFQRIVYFRSLGRGKQLTQDVSGTDCIS